MNTEIIENRRTMTVTKAEYDEQGLEQTVILVEDLEKPDNGFSMLIREDEKNRYNLYSMPYVNNRRLSREGVFVSRQDALTWARCLAEID